MKTLTVITAYLLCCFLAFGIFNGQSQDWYQFDAEDQRFLVLLSLWGPLSLLAACSVWFVKGHPPTWKLL